METALSLASGLPTLVEEETEASASTEPEAAVTPTEAAGPKRRGRKPAAAAAKPSTPSLNIIEEESDKVEQEPVKATKGKRKQPQDEEEELAVATPPAKRVSRRVTITTLDTDVDLFTPEAGPSRRRSAAPAAAAGTKKYIPIKKKTSVKIK